MKSVYCVRFEVRRSYAKREWEPASMNVLATEAEAAIKRGRAAQFAEKGVVDANEIGPGFTWTTLGVRLVSVERICWVDL